MMRPRFQINKGLFFFLFFSILYLIRITIEYYNFTSFFHIPEIDFFLYFMSFVFLPLFLISQFDLSETDYGQIFWAIVTSSLCFSTLSIFFYHDIVGKVSRISMISRLQYDVSVLSPLILSYCSALGIGIIISYLLTNYIDGFKKRILIITLALCLIPFFLGASRGSILALAFPVIYYFLFAGNMKSRCKVIFFIMLISTVLALSTEYLGSGLFDRISITQTRIDTGSEARIYIWEASIHQFLDDPVFGNSLENEQVNHYPHNLFLEVLITTGILGFIPFFLFICIIFLKIKTIIIHEPRHFWMCTIFLQAFVASMFSGALYNASWLAIGAGLVLGFQIVTRHSVAPASTVSVNKWQTNSLCCSLGQTNSTKSSSPSV
jgi:O-antigen ligase